MYFNSVKTFLSMNIQKYLSNKTISGIVHCILVQIGHIIASDIQMIWYRRRCTYTRSGVHLYQISLSNPAKLFFFFTKYFTLLLIYLVGISFYSLELFNHEKIPKISNFMAFSKFHICAHWCTILIQF